MKTRPAVLRGMQRELRLRRRELPDGPVSSIYFGGGTPSLLTDPELSELFSTLQEEDYLRRGAGASVAGDEQSKEPEITLEANPDDLDELTVARLAQSPVNRLSIGIQSFFAQDLTFMNRAHTADEARTAVEKVNRAGFHDVSIDLIYGGQTTTDAMWAENLRIATDLGVTHISAYALTVEPKTALGVDVARGRVAPTDEEKFARHFDLLLDHLTANGYQQYEVSNFCLPGRESRHNSGYWSGRPYLGIGPGAHGFDGRATRHWNVAQNATYGKTWADIRTYDDYLNAENLLFEQEHLSRWERYNEFVMTALRRRGGLTLDELRERFGPEAVPYFSSNQRGNLAAGYFDATGAEAGRYALSRTGLMRADGIAADAFYLEDEALNQG